MSIDLEQRVAQAEKARFVQLVSSLVRHRRRILGTALGAVAFVLLFSLVRPDVFRARTVLYVGESGNAAGQLLAARLQGTVFGSLGGSSSNAQLIRLILESRSLSDSLQARYGILEKPATEQTPDGAIIVEVEDRDPERAAEIAAAFPVLINKLVAQIGRQMRESKEAALTQQLREARERLETVEARAIEFQRTVAGPGLPEQVTASVTAAIQLQRQISEQEITVQRLRRTSTPENPDLRTAEAELAARRVQLHELMREGGGELLLPSFAASAELQVTGARLVRDLTEAQEIYSSVSASLASLQVTGAEDLPAISVLDPAIVPVEPANLKLWLLLPIAVILGLVVGIAGALISEFSRAARQDPAYAPLFAAMREENGGEPAPLLAPGYVNEDALSSEG